MYNCVPCQCGSIRLIPDIYIGKDIFTIKIKCFVCNRSSEAKESIKEAIFTWNQMMMINLR